MQIISITYFELIVSNCQPLHTIGCICIPVILHPPNQTLMNFYHNILKRIWMNHKCALMNKGQQFFSGEGLLMEADYRLWF